MSKMKIIKENDGYKEINGICLGHSDVFIEDIATKIGKKIDEIHNYIGGNVIYLMNAYIKQKSGKYYIYIDISIINEEYAEVLLKHLKEKSIKEIILEEKRKRNILGNLIQRKKQGRA